MIFHKDFYWNEETFRSLLKIEPTLEKLGVQIEGSTDPTRRKVIFRGKGMSTVWSVVVPHGFSPVDRFYREDSDTSGEFWFLGKWYSMMERILRSGRGELAWDSFLCAAALEENMWEGNRKLERILQSQLHLLGYNPGPVDGIIGKETQDAIVSAGLVGSLEAMVKSLKEVKEAPPKPMRGTVEVKSEMTLKVLPFGEVVQKPGKNIFDIRGPGRLVIDIV